MREDEGLKDPNSPSSDDVIEEAELERAAGDSREQRDAESVMVAALSRKLGHRLIPKRVALPDGGRVEVDAVCSNPMILCEAWAHQGPPKSAQKMKVLTDALKLAFLAQLLPRRPRLILLFSDPAAARPFGGRSWYAQAIRQLGIGIEVVELPPDVKASLLRAQARQYR
jgi:hypothetical protein